MKKMIVLALLGCLTVAAVSAQKASGKLLRHVVMFKFKDDTSAARVKSVEYAFMWWKGKISLFKTVEWGSTTTPSKLKKGLSQ